MRAVATDWIDLLGGQPQWAVKNACRTWLASEKCAFKPLPGQILTLIKTEMDFVRAIETGIRKVEQIIADQDERDRKAAGND